MSMDSDTDEADSHSNAGGHSPVIVSHPLVEEATLALLPDRCYLASVLYQSHQACCNKTATCKTSR